MFGRPASDCAVQPVALDRSVKIRWWNSPQLEFSMLPMGDKRSDGLRI